MSNSSINSSQIREVLSGYIQIYWFKIQTYRNQLKNNIRYSAPPKVDKTIQIKPRKIDSRISHYKQKPLIPPPRKQGLGQVKSGDWDQDKHQTRADKIEKVNYFSQRFQEGISPEDTDYYQWIYEKQEKSEMYKQNGFSSLENYVNHRLAKYDKLYQKIKQKGYQKNHQGKNYTPGVEHPVRDQLEVLVTIGRGGEIYLYDGHHRFGIARTLNIEIPVNVVCRHRKWQEKREQINEKGFIGKKEKLKNHPDLIDDE